jgi:hypothetical protein
MDAREDSWLTSLEDLARHHLDLVVGVASGPGMGMAIELSRTVLAYVATRRESKPPADTSWVTMHPQRGAELHMGQPSADTQPPLTLGEQPHDPANCFAHRGRPHLGPCMDAEAFTRWYWTEGPGSEPLAAEQIALATQRLVAEAYAAREQRQRWGQPS